jgi:hypothetical protein
LVPLVEREMSVIGTQPPPPERDVDVCWSLWEYVMMYVCMLALGGGEVYTHYTLHTLHTAHCTHYTLHTAHTAHTDLTQMTTYISLQIQD